MREIELAPLPEELGTRLDLFIASRLPQLTRSAAQRLIESGYVLCGGKVLNKSHRITGQTVRVSLPDPAPDIAEPEDIPLSVVYEDDWLLVVDKPKGMVVHPGAGNRSGTLVNALLAHCSGRLSGIGGVMRPGIVHRIDKDTSGLLLVAKTDAAHQSLSEQLARHSITRIYHAVVTGRLREPEGVVDAAVGRHPVHRKRMAAGVPGGRRAVTRYRVIKELRGHTYIECRLETGRTHQIRVHMSHIGHPLLGDSVYGAPKPKIALPAGQCLHAKTLGFHHPADGRDMLFDSPLPDYFTRALAALRETDGH